MVTHVRHVQASLQKFNRQDQGGDEAKMFRQVWLDVDATARWLESKGNIKRQSLAFFVKLEEIIADGKPQ